MPFSSHNYPPLSPVKLIFTSTHLNYHPSMSTPIYFLPFSLLVSSPLHSFHGNPVPHLFFTPLWPDCKPQGMLLPVDMQSTSPSNQYFWKVVTNGPQGGESTLNTYKASAGILQVHWSVGVSRLVFPFVSAKVQLQPNLTSKCVMAMLEQSASIVVSQ